MHSLYLINPPYIPTQPASYYLLFVKRERGLYGRILTKDVTACRPVVVSSVHTTEVNIFQIIQSD